jgi:hypothetical protein
VAELALDDVERNALTRELERVRVAQLVRRKAAPDPRAGGEPAELGADRGGRPRSPAGRAVDDAEQRPRPAALPGRSATAATAPSPTRPCRPRVGALPCRCGPAPIRAGGRDRARRARALPGCAARRATRRRSSPARASRDGHRGRGASPPRSPPPSAGPPGSASLVARWAPGVVAGQGRRRATPPRRVEHGQHGHGSSSHETADTGAALQDPRSPGYRSPWAKRASA